MPNKYAYAWEKMFNALTTLAEHPGPIQERVLAAMLSAHTVMDPHKFDVDFPPDARAHAKAIYERMTAVKDSPDGHFAGSVRAMSDEDAAQVARWMRELYFRVHDASGAKDWMGGKLDAPR